MFETTTDQNAIVTIGAFLSLVAGMALFVSFIERVRPLFKTIAAGCLCVFICSTIYISSLDAKYFKEVGTVLTPVNSGLICVKMEKRPYQNVWDCTSYNK